VLSRPRRAHPRRVPRRPPGPDDRRRRNHRVVGTCHTATSVITTPTRPGCAPVAAGGEAVTDRGHASPPLSALSHPICTLVVIGRSVGQPRPKDRSVAALVGLSSCGHQGALRSVVWHGRRTAPLRLGLVEAQTYPTGAALHLHRRRLRPCD